VYLSLVISDVIAPGKAKLPFEILEELKNASILFLDVIEQNTIKNIPLKDFDGLDLLENKRGRLYNLRSTGIFGSEDIQLEMVVGNSSLDVIRILNNASYN